MRQTKEQKRIEKAASDAFKIHGSGAQIDVFDIGVILAAGRLAGKVGKDVEQAVKDAIAKYRKN